MKVRRAEVKIHLGLLLSEDSLSSGLKIIDSHRSFLIDSNRARGTGVWLTGLELIRAEAEANYGIFYHL